MPGHDASVDKLFRDEEVSFLGDQIRNNMFVCFLLMDAIRSGIICRYVIFCMLNVLEEVVDSYCVIIVALRILIVKHYHHIRPSGGARRKQY